MAFDTLLVKAVEGLLSFQIQSTIDRSTDFVWLCWYASATAFLIYARNQTNTFRHHLQQKGFKWRLILYR